MKISMTQAIDLAQMAVAEKGADYVYQRIQLAGGQVGYEPSTCAYYDSTGAPSCLVGHIFYRLGLRFDPAEVNNVEAVRKLIENEVISVDPETANFLATLQNLQDEGTSWGEALRQASPHACAPTVEHDTSVFSLI